MRNDAQIVVAIFGALSRFAAEADLGTLRSDGEDGTEESVSKNNGEISLVIMHFSLPTRNIIWVEHQ